MVVMFMWLRSFWADFRSALFIRCNVPININHMHTCIYAFGCDISDMHIMMFVYCRRPGYWIIFDAASLSAPVRNCSPTFKFPFIISPSNLSLLPLPWSLLLYLNVYPVNSLFPSLPIHPSPLLPPSLLPSLPPSLLSPSLPPSLPPSLLSLPPSLPSLSSPTPNRTRPLAQVTTAMSASPSIVNLQNPTNMCMFQNVMYIWWVYLEHSKHKLNEF